MSNNHVSRFTPSLRSGLRFHVPALAALIFVAALYTGALLSLPPDAFTYHDEGAKYLQVRNLRITPAGLDWSINYPARRLDPQLQFVPFHPKQHYTDGQGRIYLQWPIFLGLLTRVPWKVMQFPGLYLVPVLAGLATLWVSYLLALQIGVSKRIAWLAIPLVGLATPIAQYSFLYFEHTLVAMLVALSMLAALRGIDDRRWTMVRSYRPSSIVHRPSPILSGALLALAVYFRSELYVLALVTAIAHLGIGWKRKAWGLPIAWGLGFALMLVPLWAFYAINEGTLLPTHALWYFAGGDPANPGGVPRPGLPPLRYIASAGWGVVPAFLFGPQTAPFVPMPPGWVETIGLAGAGLCALAAFIKLVRGSSKFLLRLIVLALGLALLFTSTAYVLLSPQPYYNLHGFLLAAPFVVLALWPADDGRRTTDDGGQKSLATRHSPHIVHPSQAQNPSPIVFLYAVSLLYVGLHALIISALSGLGPISLHEWGQRYLLPAYPLLAVLALLAACNILGVSGNNARLSDASRFTFHVSRFACLALWCALAVVGLGFTVRGYLALSAERTQVAEWQSLVRALPSAEPVVTDVWWLPLNLAADFYTRPIMVAEGADRLAQWVEEMQANGVTHFGFATTDPAIYKALESRTQRSGQSGAMLQTDGPPQEARGIWLQRYELGDP